MDKAKVLNKVYASSLPSRAKTVMFYLINRSNKELTCFPAIPTIAKDTGLSERTVQRALNELCVEGYVEKSSRYRENGGQSSNLYRIIGNEESKSDTETPVTEANIDNYDNIAEAEIDTNTKFDSSYEMQYIDFSFFGKGLLCTHCHRGGDSCVPP